MSDVFNESHSRLFEKKTCERYHWDGSDFHGNWRCCIKKKKMNRKDKWQGAYITAIVQIQLRIHFNGLQEWQSEPMIPFKPVVEKYGNDRFIPEHPKDLIRKGKMADLPWITGLNSGEGALTTSSDWVVLKTVYFSLGQSNSNLLFLPRFLRRWIRGKRIERPVWKNCAHEFVFEGQRSGREKSSEVNKKILFSREKIERRNCW